MNIFVTDPSPEISAQNLDDKRVNKMILESVQMLATAIHSLDIPEDQKNAYLPTTRAGTPYKPTHKNHPCSVWVRSHWLNYRWLTRHYIALCAEYHIATGKDHYLFRFVQRLTTATIFFKAGDASAIDFVNCSLFKTEDEKIIFSYQKTMIHKWANDKRKPTWNNRKQPEWRLL